MLKNIFVPKKDKVTGDWGELHYYELHDLCFAPDIIRVTVVKGDELERERGM